jgi:copper(I)-binding protein
MKPERTSAPPFFSACQGLLATLLLFLAAGTASAQEYRAGDITIRDAFATPTRPGASVGAAYFGGLENRGSQPDRLLRATSSVSARVELHSGEIGQDGVMRMRELDSLPLPPGSRTELKPGQGNHLMLMDLKKPLAEGDSFAMTLDFERSGKVEVKVTVHDSKPAGGHMSGHMSGHKP